MKRIYHLLLSVFTTLSVPAFAQVSLTTINAPYSQDFNTLASSGTTNDISTLPLGWTFLETSGNANTTYAAGTGSSNAGNTYSFGLIAADRALGGLQSGTLVPTLGGSFTNNTGTVINSIEIIYWGEQWRIGALGRVDRIDFQYSLDATSLANGSWTEVNELDFTAPNSIGPVGALVGNNAQNRVQRLYTIRCLAIPAGATFSIRWSSFDASGADDGLAIDDFTITPRGIAPGVPGITLCPIALDFNDVNINASGTRTYEVTAANLTEPILAQSQNSLFTLSLDGTVFSSSLTLPGTGSTVFIRFSPLVDGLVNSTITHASSGVSESLSVSGNGYDQVAHIISIGEARLQPLGTKVTVAGRVTVGLELGNPASVQDATGGIPVFDFALANTLEIGDTVIVTGPVGVFSNQKQISGSGIFFTQPDTSKRFILPKPIAIGDLAANEGLLVTVENVEVVNKSFVFYPQSTEKMTDGTTEADLRIDGDTNIPGLTKPQGTVSITGVVGRFNTNAQLLPRFQNDIPGVGAPTTPADSIPKSKTLDIANWNLEFFGSRSPEDFPEEFGPPNEDLQRQNVKTVIEFLNPDIIGVNEVSSDSLFAVLVSQLPRHRGICSPRYSHDFDDDGTFPYQKVCYIYDSTTVEVLSTRVLFEQLFDAARTTNPEFLPGCPGGPSSFYSSGRLPFLLTANITIEGVTEQINFINIHAKSGATEFDRLRRQYDLAVLKDSLDAHFSNDRFIILGDINDDLDTSIVAGAASPFKNYVNDQERYAPITKALSDIGARSTIGFQDVIDHQILSNELNGDYIPGSVQIVTPFALIPNYGTTTTDHLPVISRYAFETPVISFVNGSNSLTEDSTAVHTVHLALSTPLTAAKQVFISVGGTATAGDDFQTDPATASALIMLDLAAGATGASFTYQVIDDAADEAEESAYFAVLPGLGIDVGSQDTVTVTIADNDIPTISFAELLASAAEGSGPYTVRLLLSAAVATAQSVTINVTDGFKVSYGADYTTDPPVSNGVIVVEIPAGSSEAQFTMTPLADSKHEGPLELVSFFLASSTSGLQLAQPRLSLFVIIDVKKRNPHFLVTPNPTRGIVRLVCEDLEGGEAVQAELRNSNGKLLYSGTGTLDAVSEGISDELKQERLGIYNVIVVLDGETFVLRVLKL